MPADSPSPRPRPLSILLSIARTGLGVALLVYVLRSGGAWDSLRPMFSMAWLMLLINLVPLAGASIESLRLGVLFRAQHLHLRFSTGFRVVAIGALFNLWIPGGTGGDVMKLYYLAGRQPGRRIEIGTILLVDRAVAMVALLTLILSLLVAQPALRAVPLIAGLMAGMLLLLAVVLIGATFIWSSRVRASRVYAGVLARIPFGSYLSRAVDAVYVFKTRKAALLTAASVSVVGHGLLALTFAIVGRVLVPGASPLTVSTLALLGLVANVLPLTPGGLGVGEAASDALFRSVGVTGGAGMITAWRAGTILISVVGAVFYAVGVGATPLGHHSPAGQ